VAEDEVGRQVTKRPSPPLQFRRPSKREERAWHPMDRRRKTKLGNPSPNEQGPHSQRTVHPNPHTSVPPDFDARYIDLAACNSWGRRWDEETHRQCDHMRSPRGEPLYQSLFDSGLPEDPESGQSSHQELPETDFDVLQGSPLAFEAFPHTSWKRKLLIATLTPKPPEISKPAQTGPATEKRHRDLRPRRLSTKLAAVSWKATEWQVDVYKEGRYEDKGSFIRQPAPPVSDRLQKSPLQLPVDTTPDREAKRRTIVASASPRTERSRRKGSLDLRGLTGNTLELSSWVQTAQNPSPPPNIPPWRERDAKRDVQDGRKLHFVGAIRPCVGRPLT